MISQGSDMAFPWKLHEMLDRIERDDKQSIVSWMPSGKSFKVHKRDAFSKEILPLYFRHSNFKSFQRNLSIYQFTRIWSGTERGSYQHAHFVRGNKHVCCHITRRGAKTTALRSSRDSSPEERKPRNQQVPRTFQGANMLVSQNDGSSRNMMEAWKMLSEENSTEVGFVSKPGQSNDMNQAWNMLSEDDSWTESGFVSKPALSNPTSEYGSVLTGAQHKDLLASNDAKTIAWMLQEGVSTSDLMEILLAVNSTVPRQSIQAYSDDIISLFSNNEKAKAPTSGAPIESASAPSDSRMNMQQRLPYQSQAINDMLVRSLRPAPKRFTTLPHQQQQGTSQPMLQLLSMLEEQPFVFPSTDARNNIASVSLMSDAKQPNSIGSLGFFNNTADDNNNDPLSLNAWEV